MRAASASKSAPPGQLWCRFSSTTGPQFLANLRHELATVRALEPISGGWEQGSKRIGQL